MSAVVAVLGAAMLGAVAASLLGPTRVALRAMDVGLVLGAVGVVVLWLAAGLPIAGLCLVVVLAVVLGPPS